MIFFITIVSSFLALIGLLTKTKKDDKPGYLNRLTPFGVLVLILIAISTCISLLVQKEQKISTEKKAIADSLNNAYQKTIDSLTISKLENQQSFNQKKISEDSIRFNVTLDKMSIQLFNIQRLLYPIKNVELQIGFELDVASEAINYNIRYPNNANYWKRLITQSDSIISIIKSDPDHKTFPDGNSPHFEDGKIKHLTIFSRSFLSPNEETERNAFNKLFYSSCYIYIYQKPINYKKFKYWNLENAINIDNYNCDLEMAFVNKMANQDGSYFYYDPFTHKIKIYRYLVATPEDWKTNNRIRSVLDLVGSQLFITNESFISSSVYYEPSLYDIVSFSLNISEMVKITPIRGLKARVIEGMHFFEYVLPSDTNKLLNERL